MLACLRIVLFSTGIYLTMIMATTALSIGICVIILNIHHRYVTTAVPRWLHHVTHNILAPALRMRKQTSAVVRRLSSVSDRYVSVDRRRRSAAVHRVDHGSVLLLACQLGQIHSPNDACAREDSVAVMNSILGQLTKLTRRMEDNDDIETLKCDWKMVAKVLDRFFLIFFVVVVSCTSFIILIVYPMFS